MPLVVELPDAAPIMDTKYMVRVSAETELFFGENLGNFISTGVISNDEFESVLDGEPVLKHFQNMTINAGHVVRPSQRCKGLFILIEGDLTINGTLTMTAKGANAPGKFVGIMPGSERIYFNETDIFSADSRFVVLQKVGGAGGTKVSASATTSTAVAKHGSAGGFKLRGSGGGGAGGAQSVNFSGNGTKTVTSANGLEGNVFSGGQGGGGAAGRACNISAPLPTTDGKGGPGASCAGNWRGKAGATGGAGPAGPGINSLSTYSSDGSVTFDSGYGNGAGGLMILIVKGKINIGTTGKISSEGVRAPGVSAASVATIGTGGGSGGGIVMICHKGSVVNNGIVSVAGGVGGQGPGGDGGPGGAGHLEFLLF